MARVLRGRPHRRPARFGDPAARYTEPLATSPTTGWRCKKPIELDAILQQLPDPYVGNDRPRPEDPDRMLGGWLGRIAGCNPANRSRTVTTGLRAHRFEWSVSRVAPTTVFREGGFGNRYLNSVRPIGRLMPESDCDRVGFRGVARRSTLGCSRQWSGQRVAAGLSPRHSWCCGADAGDRACNACPGAPVGDDVPSRVRRVDVQVADAGWWTWWRHRGRDRAPRQSRKSPLSPKRIPSSWRHLDGFISSPMPARSTAAGSGRSRAVGVRHRIVIPEGAGPCQPRGVRCFGLFVGFRAALR